MLTAKVEGEKLVTKSEIDLSGKRQNRRSDRGQRRARQGAEAAAHPGADRVSPLHSSLSIDLFAVRALDRPHNAPLERLHAQCVSFLDRSTRAAKRLSSLVRPQDA